ncbi:MAG TPA: RNA polymerase sigma factor [Solirubrobacteraceae bacterium]|jgi:RNA polymerase sigma-70 factor (ECF subfamily)|nr:RNA polymerase sigma factor [Solirubrobacteraceae bacterium]
MNRFAATDDTSLLRAAATGDAHAFEVFYERHLSAVTGFHLARTGRRELAFDLTAETFAAVVLSCGSFDPARGSAAGWLCGIAANKLHASLRRGRVEAAARRRLHHEPIVVDDDDLARVDELAGDVDEARIAELLEELPSDQREAVLSRVVDERSYDEIARTMRCSQALVRQRVHRGLRRLRSRLGEPV